MEVAGLVLGVVGALPMIVQIVNGYQMISESARLSDYMAMLEVSLKTEEIILGEIYKTLLYDIVPDHELDSLLEIKPTDAKWQRYDTQIRMRLRESHDVFHFSIHAIDRAVRDLKAKLPRRPSREVEDKNWSSRFSALASEVKFRTSATLKRKDCDEALSKISENNIRLSRLVSYTATFETTRRANPRAKFAREARNTAQSLFSAVRKAMSCQCIDSHRVGLNIRQKIDESGYFRNVISFKIIFGTVNDYHKRDLGFELLKVQWKRERGTSSRQDSSKERPYSAELLSPEDRKGAAQNVRISMGARIGEALRSPSPVKAERRQKVSFSEAVTPIPVPSDNPSKEHSRAEGIAVPFAVPHITDLCAYIQQVQAMAEHSVGFIPCVKPLEGFHLSHDDFLRSFNTRTLVLGDLLRNGNSGRIKLELTERLNVALALSCGMLQLCNTQWLRKVISLRDIILLREENETHCSGENLDKPSLFVVRRSLTELSSAKSTKPINFTLLSLGVVLTHLIKGRAIEAIDISEDMTKEMLISKRDAACNKVELCDDASTNYVDAVQWCLHNCFTFRTLEDESLSREFHDAVIARLESDLGSIYGLHVQES